jgi:hypothetical protein
MPEMRGCCREAGSPGAPWRGFSGGGAPISSSTCCSQLDAIPPDASSRFCEGRRTLEQVLAGLLEHQAHQIEALTAALA